MTNPLRRFHLISPAGLTAALLLAAAPAALAQTGGVRIGAAGAPDAKAVLDLSATDKGLLIPRLTQAQRTALGTSLPNGLMIFQTDNTVGFWYFFGGSWLSLPNASTAGDNLGNHTATQDLKLAGNDLLLTPAADDNSKLSYDATAAGPVLTGLSSGQLGTRTGSVTTPVLTWTNTSGGRVGIGLASGVNPSRVLDVGGNVRLRSLSTAGVVTTDANGNLSSAAMPTDAQTLSLSGQTLAISGGNSVTLPSGGAPSGAAGGALSGTYPNPTLAANAVNNAALADDAVGIAELSATGTASASTFLRGDNTWATPTSSGWSLSGNATSGSEFVGTTNDQDLIFKRNGAEAFRVYGNGRVTLGTNSNSSLSVMLGFNAGAGATSAFQNVFVGARAGESTNNGANTFIGYAAGQQSTDSGNTLVGANAGGQMTGGSNNVFIGNEAGRQSAGRSLGNSNVVIGPSAGNNLTNNNSNNILIGGNSQANAGLYDAYAIGNNATVTQGNSLVIGNVRGTNDAISVGIGSAAPSSTLQVNGTFAVGVVNDFGGGVSSGNANGLDQGATNTTIIGGYYDLNGTTSNPYYKLPAASSCPGRIYYLRNNGSANAILSTGGGGIILSNTTATTTSYTMTATNRMAIAISDGTNWFLALLN